MNTKTKSVKDEVFLQWRLHCTVGKVQPHPPIDWAGDQMTKADNCLVGYSVHYTWGSNDKVTRLETSVELYFEKTNMPLKSLKIAYYREIKGSSCSSEEFWRKKTLNIQKPIIMLQIPLKYSQFHIRRSVTFYIMNLLPTVSQSSDSVAAKAPNSEITHMGHRASFCPGPVFLHYKLSTSNNQLSESSMGLTLSSRKELKRKYD